MSLTLVTLTGNFDLADTDWPDAGLVVTFQLKEWIRDPDDKKVVTDVPVEVLVDTDGVFSTQLYVQYTTSPGDSYFDMYFDEYFGGLEVAGTHYVVTEPNSTRYCILMNTIAGPIDLSEVERCL